MFGLYDGEEIMTLAFFVLIQYRSVTDGQTDGHSCSGSGYISCCIACYANALVIMILMVKLGKFIAYLFCPTKSKTRTSETLNHHSHTHTDRQTDKQTDGQSHKQTLLRTVPPSLTLCGW